MTKLARSKKAQTEPKKRKSSNFIHTPEVGALLSRVKSESGITIQSFTNRCLEEYGPSLLQHLSDGKGGAPSLSECLEYLEKVTTDLAYAELIRKLRKKGQISAHQELLKSKMPKSWHLTKKLVEEATKRPETRKTSTTEWQTLIRKEKDFLKINTDEDEE
jgi:hypothetical protein